MPALTGAPSTASGKFRSLPGFAQRPALIKYWPEIFLDKRRRRRSAVLDNDAFEAFRENGIFDQATATSFRTNILEKMGIMDAERQYLNFRGREPQIEPLLKNRGLN